MVANHGNSHGLLPESLFNHEIEHCFKGAGHFKFLDPAGFYRRPLFALAMRGMSVCLLDRASGTLPASSPIAPSALNGLGRSGGRDGHSGNIWDPAAKMLNK